MPITVTPIAGLSDHINDIRIRTGRIVNEKILPNEKLLWSGRRGQASDEERAAARRRSGPRCRRRSRRKDSGPRTFPPSTAAWASTSWRTRT